VNHPIDQAPRIIRTRDAADFQRTGRGIEERFQQGLHGPTMHAGYQIVEKNTRMYYSEKTRTGTEPWIASIGLHQHTIGHRSENNCLIERRAQTHYVGNLPR
jgi:hypothetical protein